jgi:Flp pilus assembly protein TadG
MLKDLKHFQNDERGTIAIIFGLTSFILFWCIGLAIDGGRAYSTNSRIARAIDTASLAGARGMRLDNLDDDQVRALTLKYFRVNFEAGGGNYSQIQGVPVVTIDRDAGSVEIDVQARVPTTFGAVGGIESINIAKSSVAVFKSTDLEISLQLDLTGSMLSNSGKPGVNKVEALKTATEEFINILIPDAPTPYKVRIGLAPFADGVNAGAFLKDVDGNRFAADGCTFERSSPSNQSTDNDPTGSDALKITTDVPAGGQCPTAEIMAMTDNKTTLINTVKTYDAKYNASTAGHLGTAWAYYLLSPKWASIFGSAGAPASYNNKNVQKIAVLMTDGDYNTIAGEYGPNNVSPQAINSIKFAKETCAAMKADGITVYTVGFKVSAQAKATLEACASSLDKALTAENGDQLSNSFRSIANQILTLKLTQ